MTTRFAEVGPMVQFGFFDADKRLAAISAKGDPLEMMVHPMNPGSIETMERWRGAQCDRVHSGLPLGGIHPQYLAVRTHPDLFRLCRRDRSRTTSRGDTERL